MEFLLIPRMWKGFPGIWRVPYLFMKSEVSNIDPAKCSGHTLCEALRRRAGPIVESAAEQRLTIDKLSLRHEHTVQKKKRSAGP